MPMDLGTRNTLLCDFMHCMTAVSLEMSDEPKKLLYVICSRAKTNLHLISETGRETNSGNAYKMTDELKNIGFQYDVI